MGLSTIINLIKGKVNVWKNNMVMKQKTIYYEIEKAT